MKKIIPAFLVLISVIVSLNVSAQLCGDARYTVQVIDSTSTAFFNNTTTYAFHTYSWDFGDGNSSTAKSLSHKYAQSGLYRVELKGIDTVNKCYDTTGKWVSIGCKSDFTYTKDGYKLTYNTSKPGAFKVRFTFGDGTSSTGSSGNHTYASFGTYNVCVIVYCTAKDSSKACESVTISSNCVAAFDIDNKDSIGKTKFTITNRSTTSPGMKYFWNLGDSTTSNSMHVYEHTYANGTYNICLTITDTSKKCSDSACQTLNVGGCSLYFSNYSRADTLYYSYTGNAQNIKINFGDGKFTTNKSGKHIYGVLGTYFLCLRAYCSSTDTPKICKYITLVKLPCMAKFTKSLDTSKKYKLFLINQSTNTPTTTYLWNFGDGGSSTSRNPTHKYTSFGKFNVCLTIKDSSCSITRCDTIGLDSSGKLLKAGGFEVEVIEYTGSVANNKLKSDFRVYPNPAGNQVSIDLLNSTTQYDILEVLDAIGQVCLIQQIQTGENNITLDLGTINPGLYFIRLSNEQESGYSKFIKK